MSIETSARLDNAVRVLRTIGASEEADAIEALRDSTARNALLTKQREGEAMDAALQLERSRKDARTFVEFVLRHTWPERAARLTHEETYGIIKHHPHAQQHGPIEKTGDGD